MHEPKTGIAASELQRAYYAKTASEYDGAHVCGIDEHFFALSWLSSLIRLYKFSSLLDVGAGTGRCLSFLKNENLPLTLAGIEPVAELRAVGRQKGLTELIEGDALNLPFGDASFDVVCHFGVLHHIKDHKRAVSEMCRVARHSVFISDSNNFGQGGFIARTVKQAVHAAGLWNVFNFIRTKGKGYHYSDGDGVFYSYSLFNDLPVVKRRFSDLRFLSTMPSGASLYRTAPNLAVFAQTKTGQKRIISKTPETQPACTWQLPPA
jgi:ubiquinone/menaquinone biosynthesis C-methylase UbiE